MMEIMSTEMDVARSVKLNTVVTDSETQTELIQTTHRTMRNVTSESITEYSEDDVIHSVRDLMISVSTVMNSVQTLQHEITQSIC